MVITDFDTSHSFWETYPDMKLALSFKRFYERDKTKDKNRTSRFMWFIALTRHPNSKYYNLPEDEKYAVIGEDYMGDKRFYQKNKEDLDILIQDFEKLTLSPARRHLMEWNSKIHERSKFLKEIPYTLDTFEDVDKMAFNTAKIYDTLKRINEDLSKEEGSGNVKGGGVASLND